MKPFRTPLVIASLMATSAFACSAAPPEDPSPVRTENQDRSVAQQLLERGFERDAGAPARQVNAPGPMTILAYVHPDGRSAALMHDDTSAAEEGVVYDPRTKEILQTLRSGGSNATRLTPKDTSCHSSWSEWTSWLQITFYESTCFDSGEGSICSRVVYWPTGDVAELGCETTSCTCASGGGGKPYHQSP